MEAFGTKLAVFADTAGALHVLDAYCRHMGGDLSRGTIKGDALACPFHDWRWGGNGRCAGIPYARRVPATARTRSWRTLEQNKQLFVWHDPQGNPPPPEVTIPRIEGAYSPEWSNWTWDSILVEGANCREVIDNVADMAHFFYIHFAFPTYFKNVFEGHIASQYLRTRPRPDVEDGNYSRGAETTLRSEASYFGPSYMIDELWHDYHGSTIQSALINCHYPVTPKSFMLQWGVIVKIPAGLPEEQADRVAAKFAKFIGLGFEQDVDDLAAQEPDRQPAAVRRGRRGLPVAPLVRAVLHRRGGHRAGHGGPVRIRGGHDPRGGRLGGRGRGEPRGRAEASRAGPAPAGQSPGTAARTGPADAAGRRPDERRAGFQWVGCDRCGAAVQVAKFSPQHTIVQWNPESVRACAEFTARAPRAADALIDTCASLRDSIDRAVRDGRLEILPP